MNQRPRSIRVSDEDWAELGRLANEEGMTISDYVRATTLSKPEALRMLRVMRRVRTQLDEAINELSRLVRKP